MKNIIPIKNTFRNKNVDSNILRVETLNKSCKLTSTVPNNSSKYSNCLYFNK